MFKSQMKGKSHVNPLAKKNGILEKYSAPKAFGILKCNYFN